MCRTCADGQSSIQWWYTGGTSLGVRAREQRSPHLIHGAVWCIDGPTMTHRQYAGGGSVAMFSTLVVDGWYAAWCSSFRTTPYSTTEAPTPKWLGADGQLLAHCLCIVQRWCMGGTSVVRWWHIGGTPLGVRALENMFHKATPPPNYV